MTTDADWEQTLFTFILHAGNARSKAKEAAELAEAGDWDGAQACLEAADANNDGALNVTDPVLILNYLFLAGPPPSAPGPPPGPCGQDPDPPGSARDLGCQSAAGC